LESPPPGFCGHRLLSPRGLITIARREQLTLLEEQRAVAQALVPSIVPMGVSDVVARVPILRRDQIAGATFEPNSMELDVSGLHQGYLRAARSRGAVIAVDTGVEAIFRRGELWNVETRRGVFSAPVLVNAAGAWADEVARLAGVAPLGLVPKRRTAFNLAAPDGMDVRAWPMVDDVGAELYFKPDAGQLLVSPADKTPSPPVDAQPEDLDVAVGVERFERATTYNVTRVARAWAGLRTFASDSSPVVGPDHTAPGFVWLAAQGGYGIKTSPALSRACAALLRAQALPEDLARLGIGIEEISPQRLRGGPPTATTA